MRWVLTWKVRDDGTTKAKARAVLLGYQDPSYEHRATTAPVMTRQTRRLVLQMAAQRRWKVFKGDVTGAFLQGRSYPDDLYCIPCPEICAAMNIEKGSITRLKKACYGLVDAPLEWYRTVSEFLLELGLEKTWADGCCWVWRPEGNLRGFISGHVDDFMFGGSESDPAWQAILQAIRAKLKWGDWESDSFTQCGVLIEQGETGFKLSQPHYLDSMKEIPIPATRRKDRSESTTDREKSQLRALLGGLSWHAQQVGPHLSAEVGILLSEVPASTIETVLRANRLLFNTKNRPDHRMLIHAHHPTEELAMYAWVDAGSQNRRDGGSTQGCFIGLGPKSMLTGEVGKISPVAWHSTRIDRACRSPGAAETQAAVNGEDSLYYARYQWGELLQGKVDVRSPDDVVSRVIGCLITDSRNVYDKLQSDILSIKGAEKRPNIELLSLKSSQHSTNLIVRWVHSEAQLANSLTKVGGQHELEPPVAGGRGSLHEVGSTTSRWNGPSGECKSSGFVTCSCYSSWRGGGDASETTCIAHALVKSSAHEAITAQWGKRIDSVEASHGTVRRAHSASSSAQQSA